MGIVKREDIIGYATKDGVFCADCVDEPPDNIAEDELICESKRDEESLYFCDRCKKQF
jgi:hypothetical protein